MRKLRKSVVAGVMFMLVLVGTAACDSKEKVPAGFDAKMYTSPIGKVLGQAGYEITGPHYDHVGDVTRHSIDGAVWQKGTDKPTDDTPVVIADETQVKTLVSMTGIAHDEYLRVTVPDVPVPGASSPAPSLRQLDKLPGNLQQFLLKQAVAKVRAAMDGNKSPYTVEITPGFKASFDAVVKYEY